MCLTGGILHTEKTTPQILSMFMGAANWRESGRRSDIVQVTDSHLSVSPLTLELCISSPVSIRGGRPAGANSLWGGGDSVRKCCDMSVAASPGSSRGQYFGSLSAEVPYRHSGRRRRLQEAVRESQTGTRLASSVELNLASLSHHSSVTNAFYLSLCASDCLCVYLAGPIDQRNLSLFS